MSKILTRMIVLLMMLTLLFLIVLACGKKKHVVANDPDGSDVTSGQADSESPHLIPNNTWPGQVWPEPNYVSTYYNTYGTDIDNAHIAMTVSDPPNGSVSTDSIGTALLWEDGEFDISDDPLQEGDEFYEKDNRQYYGTPKILFTEWDPDVDSWTEAVAVQENRFQPFFFVEDEWVIPEISESYRVHGPIAMKYLAPLYETWIRGEEPNREVIVNTRSVVVVSFFGYPLPTALNQAEWQVGEEDSVLCLAIGQYNPFDSKYEFKTYALLGGYPSDWPNNQYDLPIEPEISIAPADPSSSTRFLVSIGVDDFDGSSRIFCGQYEIGLDSNEYVLNTWGDNSYDPDDNRFWAFGEGTTASGSYIGDGVDSLVGPAPSTEGYELAVAFHWIDENADDDYLKVAFFDDNDWGLIETVDTDSDSIEWTGLQCELEHIPCLCVTETNRYTANLAACWVENVKEMRSRIVQGNPEQYYVTVSKLELAFRWYNETTQTYNWSFDPGVSSTPLVVDEIVFEGSGSYPTELTKRILNPVLASIAPYSGISLLDEQPVLNLAYFVFDGDDNKIELRNKVINSRHNSQVPISTPPGAGNYIEVEDTAFGLYLTENRITTGLAKINCIPTGSNFQGYVPLDFRFDPLAFTEVAQGNPAIIELNELFMYYKTMPSMSYYPDLGFTDLYFNYIVLKDRWYSWITSATLKTF